MTVTATKFTPEVMLSAPRRSPGVPNASGTLALYSVSTYCFREHKKTSQIRVLDIGSGESTLLVEDSGSSEPVWLSDNEILHLKSGDHGNTALVVRSATSPDATSYEAGSIKAPISNVKVKNLSDGTLVFACSALATTDGELFNPETEEKPRSSAKIYTSLFVRHWDSWNTDKRNSIFYGVLDHRDGKYSLRDNLLVNALAGTDLSSPVPPFGGTGDFDIGPLGLVFVAKDPQLDPAIYTKTDLYFVPLKSFTESRPLSPQAIKTPGLKGYSNSPVFSHCGRKVAFTRMRSNQYESDKPRLLLVPDIASHPDKVHEFYATDDGVGAWDSRPDSILWSRDDSALYVTAEHRARNLIFRVPSDPSAAAASRPASIMTPEGSVTSFHLLPNSPSSSGGAGGSGSGGHGDDRLFVTTTSLIDNSCYSVAHPTSGSYTIVSSASKQGKSFGLSRASVDSFTFRGAGDDYDVHALVVRPSSFSSSSSSSKDDAGGTTQTTTSSSTTNNNEKKKYPLCMLIHGGPQGAWLDAWSTRWNPAVFAEQGYIVVCPNPTGSTGYGMALQDGIRGAWGGRPYEDLVRCYEWAVENLDGVDADRAVALGASYGGYMINWIQGHPLGRKFKALVCHDGVFSTLNQWSTEELFFPIHDFEGTLYDNRAAYERWDPARFVAEWATPQLIIHSELDYRLPVTEGLAAFNVLQARKVPSKLLVFPDENHWVLKHENSLVWHREVLGWINKYVGIDDEQADLAGKVEGLDVK